MTEGQGQRRPSEEAFARLAAENERLKALLARLGLDRPGGGDIEAEAARLQNEGEVGRLLLGSMAEGFYAVDGEGRVTLCNAAMVAMLGFGSPGEVIGTSIHELIHHSHPDGSPYPAATCPILMAARDGQRRVVSDEVFFRRDGSSFPVEYRTEPLIRDGRLAGAICTFVDITGRLAGSRRLQESQERLALAVQAGRIGIWDYDPVAGTIRWDDRVRELFGVTSGRAVSLAENLAAIHPEDRPRVEAALAGALDRAGSGAYAVQFRTAGIEDGRLRWVEVQGQATFLGGAAVRLLGVIRDISESRKAETHLRLMVNELNHRVKNSLAMVQGLAAQTLRAAPDIDTARTAFTERLVALARAHDVLTAANWEGADLRPVVDQALAPLAADAPERITVQGPALALSPKKVLAFSLALHELATNALKYGALSVPDGRVEIGWTLAPDAGGQRLSFRWTERGGPPVAQPTRRGFGTKLIERGLASELQGEVRVQYARDGLICLIEAVLPTG